MKFSAILLTFAGLSLAVPAPLENDQLKRNNLKKRDAPPGYYLVFSGLTGATQDPTYLTYQTVTSNDPQLCADFCDSISGCTFFNLYIEHDESEDLIKCSVYTLDSDASSAANIGQMAVDGYHVTISDSSGYVKPAVYPPYDDWTSVFFDDASINAQRADPSDPDPYMGYETIETNDPAVCMQACLDKTQFDSEHVVNNGQYEACNFVNFFLLYKNFQPYQTVCNFYLMSFDQSYAVNKGYWSQEGDQYTVHGSWGFALDDPVGSGGIVTVS